MTYLVQDLLFSRLGADRLHLDCAAGVGVEQNVGDLQLEGLACRYGLEVLDRNGRDIVDSLEYALDSHSLDGRKS